MTTETDYLARVYDPTTTLISARDAQHRYLWRRDLDLLPTPLPSPSAGSAGALAVILLNPMHAGARPDAAVDKMARMARAWSYHWLDVVALYALATTDPREVTTRRGLRDLAVTDAINRDIVRASAERATRVIAAWGALGREHGQGWSMLRMLRQRGVEPYIFGLTGGAQPQPIHFFRLPPTAMPRPASQWPVWWAEATG